jgi:hypothetical protein
VFATDPGTAPGPTPSADAPAFGPRARSIGWATRASSEPDVWGRSPGAGQRFATARHDAVRPGQRLCRCLAAGPPRVPAVHPALARLRQSAAFDVLSAAPSPAGREGRMCRSSSDPRRRLSVDAIAGCGRSMRVRPSPARTVLRSVANRARTGLLRTAPGYPQAVRGTRHAPRDAAHGTTRSTAADGSLPPWSSIRRTGGAALHAPTKSAGGRTPTRSPPVSTPLLPRAEQHPSAR